MTSSSNNSGSKPPQSNDDWYNAVDASAPGNPFAKETHEDDHIESAGLDLLTGIANQTATPAEQERWEQLVADSPDEAKRLQALQASQSEDVSSALSALLQRGQALAKEMPALPDDFWGAEATALEEEPALFLAAGMEEVVAAPVEMAEASSEWATPSLGEPEESKSVTTGTPEASTGSGLWYGLSGVLALGLLFFVVPNNWFSSTNPIEPNNNNGIRAKAGKAAFVDLFLRRNKTAKKVAKPFRPKKGDALRFRYDLRSKTKAYASVFSVDAFGAFSLIYPKDASRSFAIQPGARMMPGGASLFPAQGRERLYVCVSDKPIAIPKFKTFFQSSLKKQAIKAIQKLPFPCFYQRTWLFLGANDVARQPK
ncbi:MAG: hypothetical protein EP343_32520 [Deltaproteobacteria bacterium]|nr:MAG: hypothetical protein EP343_32520 [Deltaproteobacteria bacterium]